MRKTGTLLLGCLLLVLVSRTCSLGDTKKEEPRYKDKSLSAWLSALEDKDPKVRAQAVAAMKSFGPRAKAAIPRLIPMLKDTKENICSVAADALFAIGAEAVPALIGAAKSKEDGYYGWILRIGALGVLSKHAAKEKTALPAIIEATKHADPQTRGIAVSILSQCGKDSPKALDAVIRALEDKDKSVSDKAVCALTYFGPEISKALPATARMMKDKDREKRGRAIGVLHSIANKNGRKVQDAAPILVRAARDKDFSVRYTAVLALGMVRPPAKVAVPCLLEALKDSNTSLQVAAKQALWFIDPHRQEQFRLTSPLGRIKDPQKQAQAALKLLLKTSDFNNELFWLPGQLRHTLSPTARKWLAGMLLARLSSSRELQLKNMAPGTIMSRVAAGKMRGYGPKGPMLLQDIILENGRCAWALEGLFRRYLPQFTEEVNRDPKQLRAHILRTTIEVMEATIGTETPKMPWHRLLPQPLSYPEHYP
ncbi:MAG: HEAT repeat domain-containing protein [Gemmataceae bacterium]